MASRSTLPCVAVSAAVRAAFWRLPILATSKPPDSIRAAAASALSPLGEALDVLLDGLHRGPERDGLGVAQLRGTLGLRLRRHLLREHECRQKRHECDDGDRQRWRNWRCSPGWSWPSPAPWLEPRGSPSAWSRRPARGPATLFISSSFLLLHGPGAHREASNHSAPPRTSPGSYLVMQPGSLPDTRDRK